MPAFKFGADVDLAGFYINNLRPEKVASLPAASSANDGRLVILTTDGKVYLGISGAWKPIGLNVDALEGITPAQLRDRATHSGTQPASTISDLKSTVTGYKVSDFAAADKDINANGHKVTNLANGSADDDAVNFKQLKDVESIAAAAASGISIKAPVRAVAASNIALNGIQTIDGVSISAGDRVLVANNTVSTENGIYLAATGGWTRATDSDESTELAPGTLVSVISGTANSGTLWGLSSPGNSTITPGTTAHTWIQILASTGEVVTAGNGISKTGTTIAVKLATNSGLTVGASGLAVDGTKLPKKFSAVVPTGSASPSVTHSLNTEDVTVTVREVSTGEQVLVPWTSAGTPNAIQLKFGTAPTSNQYRVTVVG